MNRVGTASRRALVALLVLFLGLPGAATADARVCVPEDTVTAIAGAGSACDAYGCEMPGGTSGCAAQACSTAGYALPQSTLTPVVPSTPALLPHGADIAV